VAFLFKFSLANDLWGTRRAALLEVLSLKQHGDSMNQVRTFSLPPSVMDWQIRFSARLSTCSIPPIRLLAAQRRRIQIIEIDVI